ncbi:hypothetical protein [Agromyces archimandritae]|uniref:Uncharacterized protein n=1 Tax=Agromyces archimandritae TaxID=2781962 RepID=A0A975FLI1_9MICO|nr:hypothetical protein [Agromyces archimandritae]QTX04107.1 hypothetical protein G127AT_12510 [Agromyces archimandritae]
MAFQRLETEIQRLMNRVAELERAAAVTDWEPLNAYLASGVSYVADGDTANAGLFARRVGPNVELRLMNVRIDSVSVPANGNIGNRTLLTGLPARYRPAHVAAMTPSSAGRLWSGTVTASGILVAAAIQPDATASGAVTLTNETLSGWAYYPAAS